MYVIFKKKIFTSFTGQFSFQTHTLGIFPLPLLQKNSHTQFPDITLSVPYSTITLMFMGYFIYIYAPLRTQNVFFCILEWPKSHTQLHKLHSSTLHIWNKICVSDKIFLYCLYIFSSTYTQRKKKLFSSINNNHLQLYSRLHAKNANSWVQ